MIVDNKAQGTFVGYFLIDNSQKLGYMVKPNAFRRFIFKLFLNWKWVDKK